MKHRLHTWALVLAGGDGSRLRSLTRNVHGVAVPKQFCSLQGGPSLLQEALQRAATVAPMHRVCAVVAAQHRHWWTSMLGYLRRSNVIVQPFNRGTAHGVLLPLLRIADMDPEALVVVLPADHYFRDEDTLIASLREAAEMASINSGSIYLLGFEPSEPDCNLGYILPATRSRAKPTPVLRFIEKPSWSRAHALILRGALWNSFTMAASVRTLLSLFDRTFDSAIQAIQTLEGPELDQAYQHLRAVDFSRDVLAGNEGVLQVLPVPACGWTDLGTPARVELTLRQLLDDSIGPTARPYFPTHLNLADQCLRLQRTGAESRRIGAADIHV